MTIRKGFPDHTSFTRAYAQRKGDASDTSLATRGQQPLQFPVPVEDYVQLPGHRSGIATNHQQPFAIRCGIITMPEEVVWRPVEQLSPRPRRAAGPNCRDHYRITSYIEKLLAVP